MRRHHVPVRPALVLVASAALLLADALLPSTSTSATASAAAGESSWQPAELREPAGMDGAGGVVAVDADGDLVAAWWQLHEHLAQHDLQVSFRPLGGSWSEPTTLAREGFSVDPPAVTFDADGNVVVAWASDRRVTVRERSHTGEWGTTRRFGSRSSEGARPRLASNAAGRIVLAWETAEDSGRTRVRVVRRSARGRWGNAVTVATSPAADDPVGHARVRLDTRGRACIAWRAGGSGSAEARVWARLQRSNAKLAGATDLGQVGRVEDLDLALAANGDCFVGWSDLAGVVRVAARHGNEEWGAASVLSDAGTEAHHPRIGVDADGHAVVAWAEETIDRRVVAARGTERSWDAPEVLAESEEFLCCPVVATNEDGRTVALWRSGDSVVSRVTDGPDEWSAPVVVSDAVEESYAPSAVAVDADGNAVATWPVATPDGDEVRAAVMDGASPSTRMLPKWRFATRAKVRAAWRARGGWSPVERTQARHRVWIGNRRASAWDLSIWRLRPSYAFRAQPDSTYCFEARGRERTDVVGAWSGERCMSVARDDRRLERRGGWTKRRGRRHFEGTFLQTRNKGATVRLRNRTVRSIALLVSTVPQGGTVRVDFAGRRLGTFRLSSKAVRTRQVIPVHSFGRNRTGTIKVTVVSKRGKRVRIDGIYASRKPF